VRRQRRAVLCLDSVTCLWQGIKGLLSARCSSISSSPHQTMSYHVRPPRQTPRTVELRPIPSVELGTSSNHTTHDLHHNIITRTQPTYRPSAPWADRSINPLTSPVTPAGTPYDASGNTVRRLEASQQTTFDALHSNELTTPPERALPYSPATPSPSSMPDSIQQDGQENAQISPQSTAVPLPKLNRHENTAAADGANDPAERMYMSPRDTVYWALRY